MKKWFIPSWNGDLRLEVGDDSQTTQLSIVRPTAHEKEILGKMKEEFIRRDWIKAEDWPAPGRWLKRIASICAPIAEVGAVASKIMRPGEAVLTAITFADGKLITHNGPTEELQEVAQAASEEGAEAAATVKRPTPSCPECFVGAVEPATEVLQAFLTPAQHETWARDRFIHVTGGYSGAQYLLAHRNTKIANRIGRICYDLDAEAVVHFHDRSVPPEEEVLAAKLILENREDWLRNEATLFGAKDVFKNPFGDMLDGTESAAISAVLGYMQALTA